MAITIVTIIGARPQFVKAAVVSRAIANHQEIKEIIIHTGQHYDASMSDILFAQLSIPSPHLNLGIGGGTHGENTGRMLEAIEKELLKASPDWVLVYGDTDSTLAGALAAAKLHIPIAHVEAGLRSFNRRMPEEINRIVTDHVSSLLLSPTKTATCNLIGEGICEGKIAQVGDVMYEAALYYKRQANMPIWFDKLSVSPGQYILCTLHRAENVDNPARLQEIILGLSHTPIPVIFPLHPRTRRRLSEFNIKLPSTINITEPVGYLEMIWLESNSKLIATDSGGVQKEAFYHGVPCITLRNETEWVELIEAKCNVLCDASSEKISKAINNSSFPKTVPELYGDGRSSEKIIQKLLDGSVTKIDYLRAQGA